VSGVYRDEGNGMAEARKGITMMEKTIVVWLVVLVLALNVVAFVVRIIDRCRLTQNLSIPSEGSVSASQTGQPAISKHRQRQARNG
jgi:dolichyl-phosphate-mannose--protein O-mannosyl transferase